MRFTAVIPLCLLTLLGSGAVGFGPTAVAAVGGMTPVASQTLSDELFDSPALPTAPERPSDHRSVWASDALGGQSCAGTTLGTAGGIAVTPALPAGSVRLPTAAPTGWMTIPVDRAPAAGCGLGILDPPRTTVC